MKKSNVSTQYARFLATHVKLLMIDCQHLLNKSSICLPIGSLRNAMSLKARSVDLET